MHLLLFLLWGMAQAQTVPPCFPEEYSLTFYETYLAVSTGAHAGEIVANEFTVGTQYWSLDAFSQRAVVSSAGTERLTVTNYKDQNNGSLVVDLVKHSCDYYPVEGGSGYAGYCYFRDFIVNARAAGVEVEEYSLPDFVDDDKHFGPVYVWSGTPPTGDPGRVLTYTLVYPLNEGVVQNQLIGYLVNGTESLPYDGQAEPVQMSSRNIRYRYTVHDGDATFAWPSEFFDAKTNCPF